MKDYIELEQVKKIRDEYRQCVHGSSELYEQEKFFTQYKKEVKTVLNRIYTALEEGRVIANEKSTGNFLLSCSKFDQTNTIRKVL